MTPAPYRYRSDDEDSARWLDFAFRPGDLVISTRSKSGTTWMQMICALLVLQTPDLPEPMNRLSPWLDWLVLPLDDVLARLAAQPHRRFVKTHTPLDGLPLDPRATFVVVARHPLDQAVSLYHHSDNLDRERTAQLLGGVPGTEPPAGDKPPQARPPVHDWLMDWIEKDVPDPRADLDSLPGVLLHLSDAWSRRAASNVVLVHYEDLSADLSGQMRRLAARLEIDVPDGAWPGLIEAAGFEAMRAQAAQLAPGPDGVLKDRAAFFRRGGSGDGRELLTDDEWRRYLARVDPLAPSDLLAWLHREQPQDQVKSFGPEPENLSP